MATQYTAGLTQGQKLTADIMNQIGAAWETWTPTVTSSSGSITSYTIGLAKYTRIQKLVIAHISITVTNAGTAAGTYLDFTLPLTSAVGSGYIGGGREGTATGNTLNIIFVSTTKARFLEYDNTGTVGTGVNNSGLIVYEAA
jgi:hypothetical protein